MVAAVLTRPGLASACFVTVSDGNGANITTAHGDIQNVPARGLPETDVSISGGHFSINGAQTSLPNSRMINAIFDDDNSATVGNWAYSDTGVWDPERNTNTFDSMVPTYAADGLKAVTVGLQGGRPVTDRNIPQNWIVSAYNSDGSLKSAWMNRLDEVLTTADTNGMVVIVNLFYAAQDKRLASFNAIEAATQNISHWLTTDGPNAPYTNVIVDVANEVNTTPYTYITPTNVTQLIDIVQTDGLLASTSFSSAKATGSTADVVGTSDFVLIHGNGLTPSQLTAHIDAARNLPTYSGQPVLVNEDGTDLNNESAAWTDNAGWGYFDDTGFQVAPSTWAIDTPEKQAFFDSLVNAP